MMNGFEEFQKAVESDPLAKIDFFTAATRADIGAVEAFCEYARGKLMFDKESGSWYHVDEETCLWSPDPTKSVGCKVTSAVWDALNEFIADSGEKYTAEQQEYMHKWGRKSLNAHAGRESLLKMARGVDHMWASNELWNHNPFALNCLNGLLDVKTGEFRSPEPSDYLTQCAAVPFDPDAGTGEEFKKVLLDVFEGNEEVIRYLQKSLGYSILGLKNGEYEQKFFICYGPRGGNGKNTIFDPIVEVLGTYAGIAAADTFNFAKTKIPEDLHQLRHSRLILASEPSQREQMDEEMIKAITGNKEVRTRKLHENSTTWSPKFCVWMLANHFPRVPNSDSLFRRFVMFPFNRVFRKEERKLGLGRKLFDEEGPAILNWLIEGAHMWMEEHIGEDPPEPCAKTWDSFRSSVDVLGCFVSECCTKSDKGDDPQAAMEVFMRYKQFCHDNNYYPLGRNKFYQELVGYGAEAEDSRTGKVFTNFKLIPGEATGTFFS